MLIPAEIAVPIFDAPASTLATNSYFSSAVHKEIWQAERDSLISKARMKNGADMSTWGVTELIAFQRMLKEAQQEKAKKEKLAATKTSVQNMAETKLRSRIAAFLDQHPEFCDSFME